MMKVKRMLTGNKNSAIMTPAKTSCWDKSHRGEIWKEEGEERGRGGGGEREDRGGGGKKRAQSSAIPAH